MEKDKTIGLQRLTALFDAGSFAQMGAYWKRENGDASGVLCGYGAVNGRLVYAFAQDSDRQKGAFDAFQARKIGMLYEAARKNGAPVVGLFDSAGAYISDGASALSAYGSLLGTISRASGEIPQIALIAGVCSGMAATAAAMFDLAITVKGQSEWFVNAPFLIGDEVGTADYTAEKGLSSICEETEDAAIAKARALIDLLPSNCNEGAVLAEDIVDDINRLVTLDGCSAKETMEAVADLGRVIELGESYAPEMKVALATVGGVCCGMIANDAAINGGVLTSEGARKAARMIAFCDSFGIPVITLTDSLGVSSTQAEEGKPLAAELGKLAMAYASATTAKITVVVGKAYGASFAIMGSRALGADTVYALDSASISIMKPESAVAFLWNGRITEEVSREDLVKEWNETCADPAVAAADGSIDDVIPSAELRSRICSAVYMLLAKNDAASNRKHCNLPL